MSDWVGKKALWTVTKFLRCQDPDVNSIISTRGACVGAWVTSDFHQKVKRLLWSQTTCVLYFITNLGLPLAKSLYHIVCHFFLHSMFLVQSMYIHAVSTDLHSQTLSGLPVFIIGLSAELAKVLYLAIVELFPNDGCIGGCACTHVWQASVL